MTLKKRYKRDIKHNLSLYISSTCLTILSLLLFYLYLISGTGIMEYSQDFFTKQKIEDAHFSTYININDEEIKKLEKKYDLVLEKQEYLNIDTNGTTARIFAPTQKVDCYKVTHGSAVKDLDDIVISEGYAKQQKLAINDHITIANKTYTITGLIERPDYLYMLENLNDSYKNINTFYLAYLHDDAFTALGDKNAQYLVRYHKHNDKEFRKEINDNYILSDYLDADDNMRISMVSVQAELFIKMSYFILVAMSLFVVILISIILSRKIKSEQKMIGTLSAYGYTNKQIITHYAGFAALPGIIGGILTTILIYFFADDYGALGLMDYEPMPIKFHLDAFQMALGILVPTIMYILSTMFTVNKLLKHNTTELLSGSVQGKNKTKKIFVKKKINFRFKLSLRSMLANLSRTAVFFLGVFLSSYIVIAAFTCYDSMANIAKSTADNMGEYNYQYVLNELRKDDDYGKNTLLSATLEDQKGSTISLIGADGNELIALKNKDKKDITIDDDHYYITSIYATANNVNVNDTITLMNPLSTETFRVKIDGIVEDNFIKAIYTTRKNVSEMVNLEEDYYNMILSKTKLELSKDSISTIISKDSIHEQYDIIIDQMNVIIYAFIAIGILLCIIAVHITVTMLVSENRATISMLHVLGYTHNRIHKLLLHDYIYIVLLAIIISIPCGFYTMKAMFYSYIDLLGYFIEPYIKVSSLLIGIALVLFGYQISLYLVKRKINKVDMVESLKDNRE